MKFSCISCVVVSNTFYQIDTLQHASQQQQLAQHLYRHDNFRGGVAAAASSNDDASASTSALSYANVEEVSWLKPQLESSLKRSFPALDPEIQVKNMY